MKYLTNFSIIVLCLLAVSCYRSQGYFGMIRSADPIHIQLADREMFEFANELECEGLILASYGGAMRLDVQSFSMKFLSMQQVDIDGARRIFIDVSERFLQRINVSESLRPYLSTYPMTLKNLDLAVLFSPSFTDPFDNYVTTVGMLNTLSDSKAVIVAYGRFHPENEKIDLVYQESYQRALGILEHQNNVAGVPPFCLRSDTNDKGP